MKYKELKYIFVLSVAILLFMPALVSAKGDKKENGKRTTLAKTSAGQITTAAININNLNALQSVFGFSDYNPDGNLEGTEYPKGTARNAIYETGFLWGGYDGQVDPQGNPQVQVGGSAYKTGLQPGPILSDGNAADPSDPRWSIYRVRPDIYPGGPDINLSADAASTTYWDPANPVSADVIRQRYDNDWTYWPAHGNPNIGPDAQALGAPFKDVNNDGMYEPDIDVPGVPGADQTIFYVANDMNDVSTQSLYGAHPMGLEVHVTIWAYAQQAPLGNMYFKQFTIVNKGKQQYTIDSMIVTWWADIDLGFSGDDLVGNDTTLSLTYVYNGNTNDAVYQPLPPPSTGADFFQGPLVQGVAGEDRNQNGIDDSQDYGLFNGDSAGPGYINLPMTAAYTFTNPGSGLDATFNDPDQGQISGSTQFYNFMKGLNRIGGPYIDPNTNTNGGPFFAPGDPVTQTGWIDGDPFPPRDVRSGMASGPFTMAPGDTQQVVVAELVAGAVPGINNLQAINILKVYDKTAQNAYDHFFNLPKAPPSPILTAVSQDQKIVLDWGEDPNAVQATESSYIKDEIDSVDASGGGYYSFEGYNIYQLPYAGASIESAHKITTFDVVNNVTTIPYTDPVTRTVEPSINIQSGSDSGIQRFLSVSTDAFHGNKPLNNGTPYYFAVTAYSYNPKGLPQALETPIQIISVTPHSMAPGVRGVVYGDTLATTHSGGSSGAVYPIVVNPDNLTNMTYTVTFEDTTPAPPTAAISNSLKNTLPVNLPKETSLKKTSAGIITWSLKRSDGTILLSGQTNQDADVNSPIVDGIQWRVAGAPLDFADFYVNANADGPVDPPAGASAEYNGFPGLGRTNIESQQSGDVSEWLFTHDVDWYPNDQTYPSFKQTVTYVAGGYGEPGYGITALIPDDYEIRFTATGGKACIVYGTSHAGEVIDVPFEIWDVGDPNDPNDDFQCFPALDDRNDDGAYDYTGDDSPISGATNDPVLDYIYWLIPTDRTPGSSGYQSIVDWATANGSVGNGIYYKRTVAVDGYGSVPGMIAQSLANWNGGDVPGGPFNALLPEEGTVFHVATTKPNTINDEFTIPVSKNAFNANLAKTDVQAINVFPNPYYGVNYLETNKYQKFVTFNHLPNKATIRIFNLAGYMVKSISHTSGTMERWDLTNRSGLNVASGLYIAYIDMPDVGTTKILKFSIIQEQQIPDHF